MRWPRPEEGRARRRRVHPSGTALARPWTAALAAIVSLLAGACAATPESPPQTAPRLEITGIEIRNELAYPVSDVRVLVSATGEFVACSQIMGGTACQTSFPLRSYRGNAMRVTWNEHGEPQVLDDFVLKAPDWLAPGKPAWLQIVIFAPGDAGARLLSERPELR